MIKTACFTIENFNKYEQQANRAKRLHRLSLGVVVSRVAVATLLA
jgi:hypothetical protein